MNTTDTSLPNFTRPELAAVRPDLDLLSDLLAGTRRMQDEAQAKGYIRKWADEDPAVYTLRRQCENVFEGLGRTLSACVGMLFAKAPAMEWNASEAAMAEQCANLDAAGSADAVLCKRFSEMALRDGLGIILVDHTPAPIGPDGQPVRVTGATEGPLGLRPTWALYPRAAGINWFHDAVNGQRTLTQLTLETTETVRDGAYGIRSVRRYRDLRMILGPEGDVATWRLREETKDAGADGFRDIGSGVFRNRKGEAARTLPVAIAYTGRSDAPMCATIPLLGVAWANLSHWQISTDLRFGEMVAAHAQAVVTGELKADADGTPGRVRLGPLACIQVIGEGAAFDWKAPPVEAFASLERAVTAKEKQIGQMGLSFMVSDTRAAETAAAKQLDTTAENSTLATVKQGIEDAWNAALESHAWYLGIEKADAPVITINSDFGSVVMDAATMTAWATVAEKLKIPVMVVLEALQQGGRIKQDADLEEIEAAIMVNAAAAEAEAERQREMQVEAMQSRAAPKGGVPAALNEAA